MPDLTFDHLFSYDELTAAIHELAARRSDLCTVTSIGRSHEGRDIWLATITNAATGPPEEKPAVWVDANIHATEITGSTAALHLVHRVVTEYGTDERITRAVDTRTFYVVPRVNPDGVELALASNPTYLRSSTRKWPRTDDAPGLVESDADGDGRILTMRVEDPNGAWKVAADDARLMVPRAADEDGAGPYYRLLPEGTMREYDGALIPISPERRSLDLNRNFPIGWRTESEQQGAGPYPSSEPEVRTVMQAIVERPNICVLFAYHTFSAVILRPYDDRNDDAFPTHDLERYKEMGAKATELTGYKTLSVFHDFRYDPKDVTTGAADSWAYDHRGIFGWTVEFWSPLPKAGITEFHYIRWFEEHPVADDVALLRWNDDTLGGRGFVDWYEFEHPQLGRVELGGWDWFRTWTNAPPELMHDEVAPLAEFVVYSALVSPRLRVRTTDVLPVGDDAWRVSVVVENDGWLPTNVTEQAVTRKVVRPVEAELGGADCEILQGKRVQELGQLAGRSRATTMVGNWGTARDATDDRAKAEWVVRAPGGTTVDVVVRHERAGTARADLVLK